MEINQSTSPNLVFDSLSGIPLKPAIISIGSWDMNTDTEKEVDASDLAGLTVVSLTAMITTDNGFAKYPINFASDADGLACGGMIHNTLTNVFTLSRRVGGLFDGILFGSSVINRGYIMAWYFSP